MKPDIKQRIEQIRRGEVPEGYKKTKAGIIPEEWKEKILSHLLTFKNGINGEKEKFGSGIKLISVREILSEKPITYDSIGGCADVSKKQLEEYSVSYGDILFQRSSENYEDAGSSNVYLDKEKEAVFSGFVIRGKKKANYDPIFLNSFLRLPYMRNEISRKAAGAQHVNIGQDALSSILCIFPPLPEQQKIADILTAQDRVIELKEQLLTQKQQQKKHLMQQLLTGKKRLPGFSGEWKKEHLGKLFSERKETNCQNLEMLAITGNQGIIPRAQLDLKDNSSDDKSKYLKVCIGDIGYNTMRMWQGVSAYSNYEGIVSPAYTILKPCSNINAKYFSYLFKMPKTISLFYRFSQGLVDDTRNLKYENFKKIRVQYPIDKEEQNAIADVLSTADREIDLLRQSIEAEKQKKKALMQLLLTGIVRVSV